MAITSNHIFAAPAVESKPPSVRLPRSHEASHILADIWYSKDSDNGKAPEIYSHTGFQPVAIHARKKNRILINENSFAGLTEGEKKYAIAHAAGLLSKDNDKFWRKTSYATTIMTSMTLFSCAALSVSKALEGDSSKSTHTGLGYTFLAVAVIPFLVSLITSFLARLQERAVEKRAVDYVNKVDENGAEAGLTYSKQYPRPDTFLGSVVFAGLLRIFAVNPNRTNDSSVGYLSKRVAAEQYNDNLEPIR